jgi:tetrahydromethanopterin S-methyltransferase subunit G
MQELEELKRNIKKLEELTNKMSFMLKEVNYLIGVKGGHNTKHVINTRNSGSN